MIFKGIIVIIYLVLDNFFIFMVFLKILIKIKKKIKCKKYDNYHTSYFNLNNVGIQKKI